MAANNGDGRAAGSEECTAICVCAIFGGCIDTLTGRSTGWACALYYAYTMGRAWTHWWERGRGDGWGRARKVSSKRLCRQGRDRYGLVGMAMLHLFLLFLAKGMYSDGMD